MAEQLIGNIRGPQGNGIASINYYSSTTDPATGIVTTTYKITYTDANAQPTYFSVDSGATGATGLQGPKGDKGDGFSIAKTYSSISDMNADKANVEEGQLVMIASNVNDADNAKLYVKGDEDFTFIADLSGATGIQGVGISSVSSGSVSGVESNGATRTYNINLTNNESAGSFIVKDGEKGATGTGIDDITKGTSAGLTDTYNISLTDGSVKTFTVTNGQQGEKGDKGDKGDTGEKGDKPVFTVDEEGNLYVDYVSWDN